jgi:hypothetical protein
MIGATITAPMIVVPMIMAYVKACGCGFVMIADAKARDAIDPPGPVARKVG